MHDQPHLKSPTNDRVVRVFISSTFRDFERERDLLTRRVFPELRRRAAERGLEIVGVDLRWGITQEQAERGETLPICLAEIDRCRPYFVGLLGERYGWTPDISAYPAPLLEVHPWLREHCSGTSVTELEILHGVINRREMTDRAVFCVRATEWSESHGMGATDERERLRTQALRIRIAGGGHTLHQCRDPEEIYETVLRELWRRIDSDYPIEGTPSAAESESRTHSAFAASRRRLFVGRKAHVGRIASIGTSENSGCLITAASGIGKSAVLAMVAAHCADAGDAVFEHYPGASGPAASLHALLSRLHSWIDHELEQGEPVSSESDRRDDSQLAAALPERLAKLGRTMVASGRRTVIVVDALDRIPSEPHLPWLPGTVPAGVRVIMASTDLRHTGPASRIGLELIELDVLAQTEQAALLRSILEHHRKRMSHECETTLLAHPLACVPIFLTTVAGELCVAATHDSLADRVREACLANSVADAVTRVLMRIARDLPDDHVLPVMSAIRCSRDGLSEDELRGACTTVPASWARIRLACEDLLHESDGRIRLRHDHVAYACDAVCMTSVDATSERHSDLANWWLAQGPSTRAAFELPWQLINANRMEDLRQVLLEPEWFSAILATRPEIELLGILNKAGMESPSDIERMIAEQWPRWAVDLDDNTRGRFAQSLGGFIGFATNGCELAVELLAESVEFARRAGTDGESLAIRLNNLGHEYLAARRSTEATTMFAECLAIRERVLGRSHPHFMATLDNLGQSHAAAGDPATGVRFLREALELRRTALGDAHPDTCTSKNNLAMTLRAADAAAEAGPLLEEAYRDTLVRLGPDHSDSGIAAGNLGGWHASHGDYDRARLLLTEAVEVHRRSLGATHPYVAVGESRIADLELLLALRLREEGRLDEAAQSLRQELEIRAARYGADSVETATVYSALGETYARMGRTVDAHAELSRSLAIRTQLLGPDDPATERVRARIQALQNQ